MTTKNTSSSLHVVESPQGMDTPSKRYIGPLLGNGELTLFLDEEGLMSERNAITGFPEPRIHWAGRRLGVETRPLVSFGRVVATSSWDWLQSTYWSQHLDPKQGLVTTRNTRIKGEETTETALLLDRNLLAFHKSVKDIKGGCSLTVGYQLCDHRSMSLPEGFTITGGGSDEKGAWLDFRLDGVVEHLGRIALWVDRPCKASWNGNNLQVEIEINNEEDSVTAYLAFADNRANEMFYKQNGWRGRHANHPLLAPLISELHSHDNSESDPVATIADMMAWTASEGWNGVKAHQAELWKAFFDKGWIKTFDDPKVQEIWETGMYATRTQLTKWSIPVAIHKGYFNGQYFFDELAGVHALLAAGHYDLVKRCADTRLSLVPIGMQMTDGTAARLEQAMYEGGYVRITPLGCCMYEVHANGEPPLLAWNWAKYSGADKSELERYYPIFWGTAEFFRRWMVYKDSNGTYFTGRCVDNNESIPAVINGAATVASAVTCMKLAADVAEMLGRDADLVEQWREIAAGLAQKPRVNSRGLLCQYEGDEGVAMPALRMVKNPFTNGFIDPHDPVVAPTVQAVLKECKLPENWAVACSADPEIAKRSQDVNHPAPMAWTWSPAKALSAVTGMGDGETAIMVVNELIRCCCNFGSMYELKCMADGWIGMPWFVTSMAELSAAISDMLIQCKDDVIDLLPAVPKDWRNFEFKLAAHNRTTVEVAVKDGVLSRLDIQGPQGSCRVRIPARFAPETLLGTGASEGETKQYSEYVIQRRTIAEKGA